VTKFVYSLVSCILSHFYGCTSTYSAHTNRPYNSNFPLRLIGTIFSLLLTD
jgi:hypothetical protein